MLKSARQFYDLLERWGTRFPGRVAYTNGVESATYAELLANIAKVATHIERSARSRNPVLVVGHKEPAMLAGFLGVALTGRAYVPIDDKLPADRLAEIRELARPSLELTAHDIASVCREMDDGARRCNATADDAVYVLFTSGSTGTPKGVVITWNCLLVFINWMLAEQKLVQGEEIILGQAPFTFDLSVMDLYLSLTSGATHVSLPREMISSPSALFTFISRAKPTTWISTPSFAAFCAADPKFKSALLPHLRRFIFCGETLSHRLARTLLERFPDTALWNTYGPTECTVAVTSLKITQRLLGEHNEVPLGLAMPGTTIFLGDEQREPGGRRRGEILIAGPTVSPGYLGRPDLTRERFFEQEGRRAYATGDRGSLRNGLLFFEGRIDQQVKINGYRIELEDVEENLSKVPGVLRAAVVPITRGDTIEGMAAFVHAEAHHGESEFAVSQRLRSELSKKVPAYMLPKKWILRCDLPTTANGKIDRKRLASELSSMT